VGRLPAPDPSGKQVVCWDEELPGFGVLVSGTTAVKTYIAQHRIRGLGGKHRRVTIGRIDTLDLDAARDRARVVLSDMLAGKDPKRRPSSRTLRATVPERAEGSEHAVGGLVAIDHPPAVGAPLDLILDERVPLLDHLARDFPQWPIVAVGREDLGAIHEAALFLLGNFSMCRE